MALRARPGGSSAGCRGHLAGPEGQGRCQEGPARFSQRRSWHPLSARTDHPAHRGHRRHRVPQEAQATHAPARGLALFWFQTLDRASRPQADTKPGWQDQTQRLTSPYANTHTCTVGHMRICSSAHSQQIPGLRQARGIKPESAFTDPIPPGPPLTTHSGGKPLRGRSANKNYTGGGRQRCDPRSRRLCIFCMP